MLCLLTIAIFYTAVVTNTASATTYYVSAADGSDSNPGTSGSPWKTLNRAYTWYSGAGVKVTDGDTVKLRNGNYGSFAEMNVTHTNWITYEADDGEVPVLTGISINRYPNPSTAYLRFRGITVNVANLGEGAVGVNKVDYVEFIDCNIVGAGYVDGDDSYGFYLKDSNYITIQGCAIYGDGDGVGNEVSPSGMTGELFGKGFDSGIYVGIGHPAKHVDVNDCDIWSCNSGILLDGSDWHISNNNIHHMTTDGIVVCRANTVASGWTDPVIIENNHIHHLGIFEIWMGYRAHGDLIQTQHYEINHLVIRGNNCHDNDGQGFFLRPDDTITSADWLIENNLIYRVGLDPAGADHAVRLYSVKGVVFRNNTIGYSNEISGRDFLAHNESGEMRFTSFCGNIIHTVDIDTEAGIIIDYENYNVVSVKYIHMDNHTWGPNTVVVPNSAEAYKAIFNNHDANDFTLAYDSVAINSGNATYAPTTDILGHTRVGLPDAGCYEYTSGIQSYSLSITAVHGTVTKSPDSTSYSAGETVTLQATPNTGYHFVNWTGDASGTSDSATITMNSNKSVTANFAINTYTLTITATNGSVTKTPDKSPYNYGDTVTLGATANTGYHFSSWSGDASGTSSTTAIVMNSNKSVTANFSINTYTLTVNSTNGSISKSPDKANYNYGEQVTLQAVPATGYHFSSWSGNASGTSSSTTITMNANKLVVANFAINTYTLDVTVNATAFGSVNKTPDNDSYNYGETVTIQAFPNPGYAFSWAGDASGTDPSVTITMNSNKSVTANFVYTLDDNNAPSIDKSSCKPLPNAIQVPLNILIEIHIVDEGRGIDANTVSIAVNNNLVYTADTADYNSTYGRCQRTGDIADYTYFYQPNQYFDFDQSVTVAASAADLAGNQMSDSYSFRTEMRSFGKNLEVDSGTDSLANGHPATLRDSSGNIWAAWHKGSATSRDIYIGKLTAGNETFETSIQLTNDVSDQCNPAIAKDSTDKLYVVWQDNRRGNWDIYLSTSVDGISWSTATRITDSNTNQVNPAIAIDRSSPNKVYVAWQDDRNINQDIFVATSTNSFLTKTTYQVTTDSSDQTEPVIVTDAANTAYIFWTDLRNGSKDIYGAASTGGLWSNVAIVTGSGDQSEPAVAAEATGATLHLLWVDNSPENKDIFYASCSGSLHALSGASIADETTGADQPSITVTGSTGNNLKVFACWRDERNTDADLYFVQIGSGSGTNILVEDNGTGAEQSTPVIGIDASGYPYILWVDDRNAAADIFYAGSTYARTTPLFAQNVSMTSGTTIGKDISAITNQDDISVIIPKGTYLCDVNVTVSRIENPPNLSITFLSALYEFGPSGITFDQPVTLIIPYIASGSDSRTIYWYDILTAAASQEGVTNVEDITIFGTLHAIRFKTDHFTPFFVGSGGSSNSGGSSGGGGGGCSLAPPGKNGNIIGFVLPFLALGLVITVIKRRDRQNHKRLISKINKV